ncbi:AbrB family transcriptional regulator [Cohnella sp.]|uniref:AbrB family transcriptional regulator n=1 Tax=Cohnella sp. TaxID=1883426 RepID=UPI00356A367F
MNIFTIATKRFPTGITLLIALGFGCLFTFIHMPIPWLLGPMLGVCLFSRVMKSYVLYWPRYFQNAGLIIAGYAIGLTFTQETLTEIVHQLPSMVLMTLLLLLLCLLISYGVSKLAGTPYPTALTGSIPGGLTQMVVLAEETKGIDITIVTFLQVSRLMMIVIFVPLLIFSPLFGGVHSEELSALIPSVSSSWGELFPSIIPYAIMCTGCALLGKKFHFPTTFLLAPLIAAALLHLSGLHGPVLPSSLMNAAQLMIGCYVGLLLKLENLPNKSRLVTLAIVSGAILVISSCGLSYLLAQLHPVSPATSLLSLAPGGMDQMGIIAHEINANVSIVTGYQLFRTFFIFFAVPPLLRLIFARISK